MNTKTLNKIANYKLLKRTLVASTNAGLFSLSLLAALSITQFIADPTGSLMFNAQLDPLFWTQLIIISSVAAGLVYSLLTTPVFMMTKVMEATKRGVSVTSGILRRRKKLIPYSSIESVEVDQAAMQKPFSVVSLSVNTHSGEALDFTIAEDTAENFLDEATKQLAYSK